MDKSWHELLDSLCIEQGHLDNIRLSTAFCEVARDTSQSAYESALKNIGHWRSGQHTPNRRNFRILTIILKLDEREDIRGDWNRRYEDALRRKPEILSEEAATDESPPSATRRRPVLLAGALALAVATGGAGFLILGPVSQPVAAKSGPQVIDVAGDLVRWRRSTELVIGESAVIHGERGACGQQPAPWEETVVHLPSLDFGVWSDGGVGHRVSRACGGPTPVRAIVFTGQKPGLAEFVLFDDAVRISVK
ncbi:MAG: hypothetical protein RIC36_10180 [Rhodospirillales bacterium]